MSDRPVIFFVDDEPHNLAVFEAAMPEKWEVKVFDNPLSAVEQVEKMKPNLIISDQRMPGMKGVRFLELTRKLSPNSVRILATGYSDEDLIIDSVREAKVFDYIRKPWDVDELVKRLEAAMEFNLASTERDRLEAQLRAREQELTMSHQALLQKSLELEKSLMQLQQLGTELACWVPPAVTWFAENKTKFPVKKDLAVMAIDIIDSSATHGLKVGQKSLRSFVLEQFSMLVLKHGGYVESTEGDASYANFGLSNHTDRPCDAALAVADEFRAALRGIASHHGTTVECGIGLHFSAQTEANISETHVSTAHGVIVQKNFYTSSPHIDLVHRMEKFVHKLPGSNIVFTRAFLEQLSAPPLRSYESIGEHLFKGQSTPVELLLIRSSLTKDQDVSQLLPQAAA